MLPGSGLYTMRQKDFSDTDKVTLTPNYTIDYA
jgi:hypothetical protein